MIAIESRFRARRWIHHRGAERRSGSTELAEVARPSDSTELVEVSRRGPQPNRPRARTRSAAASTGPGLCVRFVPLALSAAGLAEMRFVRHLLARRWVGQGLRRDFDELSRVASVEPLSASHVSSRSKVAQQSRVPLPRDISSFCELLRFSRSFRPSKT
jgi:hypothetical protein